ncbi:SMP-30/gluconolactonase/LRE family protein [Shewanella sp. KJ2020]|nr:SMP-30/gluconolactonase/LRE family protein [Shewanella sp. KJ2020]MCP3127296.1 SMP-30/gluconolactonase/LRE family protein [Shewanella sp. KJ2020]
MVLKSMPLDIFRTPNGGGQVVRYRPNGQVDLTLTLPVTNPTSIP